MRHGESEGRVKGEEERKRAAQRSLHEALLTMATVHLLCMDWKRSLKQINLEICYVYSHQTSCTFTLKVVNFVRWYCLREWWSLCVIAMPYLSLFASAFRVQLSKLHQHTWADIPTATHGRLRLARREGYKFHLPPLNMLQHWCDLVLLIYVFICTLKFC